MAPSPSPRHVARHRVPPDYTPRLRLKPKSDDDGYLDGAWWPRSGDLATELPDLLTVLAIRTGPIHRVVYDRESWSHVPDQLLMGDHPVRLDGYPFELGNTMYLYGSNGAMIVLRVISPTTHADTAHSMLMSTVARR